MQVGQLTVSLRNSSGKGPARQLRAQGKVPGVFYGASTEGPIEPFAIAVDVKALKAALDPVRRQNTVISVTIEDGGGKSVRTLSALLKEYQIHPLRREVTHVDLLAIDPSKEVQTSVPLEFTGKPKGAIEGGILHTVMRSIEIRAKPSDIPTKLPIDVSPLEIGDVLHVSDIPLPAGVIAITGGREAVISMQAPEKEVAPTAEAAAAVPEAGKDAKAAAGAPGKDAKGAAPAKDAKGAAAKAPSKK